MGTWEIILIFVVYLLLFGSKGIPSLAQTLGRAVRQFRDATSDIQREMMQQGREIQRDLEAPLKEEEKEKGKEVGQGNP
jgi:TatA/E family protein of Tat protein translocase